MADANYDTDSRVLDAAVKAFNSVDDYWTDALDHVSDTCLRERLEAVLDAVRDPRLGDRRFITIGEVRAWLRDVSGALTGTLHGPR